MQTETEEHCAHIFQIIFEAKYIYSRNVECGITYLGSLELLNFSSTGDSYVTLIHACTLPCQRRQMT